MHASDMRFHIAKLGGLVITFGTGELGLVMKTLYVILQSASVRGLVVAMGARGFSDSLFERQCNCKSHRGIAGSLS